MDGFPSRQGAAVRLKNFLTTIGLAAPGAVGDVRAVVKYLAGNPWQEVVSG